MRKIYNPQERREIAERAIMLALNFHKYGTLYPTEDQIKQAAEAEQKTDNEAGNL